MSVKSAPPPRRRGLFGLMEGVRRLLDGGAAEVAGGPAPANPPRDAPDVPAGRFSLVGLDAVREALGPRWSKVAPEVHALAEAVITRRLEPGDVFERTGDGYVVLLPRLTKPEADLLCASIAREIAAHLLGADWDGLAAVETVRADVPREALGSMDLAATLQQAFVDGVRSTAAADEVRKPGPPLYLDRAADASASLDPALAPAWEQDGPGVAGTKPWLEQTGPGSAPVNPWVDVDLGDVDVPRLSAGAGRHAPLASHHVAPVTPDWRYAPIWDFRQQALIRFRLHASAHGRQVHPYQGLEAASAEPVLFENDLQALSRIAADFAQLSAQGRRLPIICPVHDSSISLESRRSWLLHTLREVPPALRRLLTIEVVRPHGAPWTNSLHDFVAQLRGSGAGLTVCLPLDRVAEIPLIADSARAISTQTRLTGLTETRCIELLGAFAARARQSKLECGVYGLATRSLVMAASAAGFRFLSGEAIHPELETPDTATRFQALDLYQASA